MRYKSEQSGFSAVELLITLFIAAVFLISGFELYAAIVKNGGDARMMASASSVVTDYIQRYKSTATNPCTVQTPLTNSSIPVSGLSNVTVTVAIQCPYNSGSYKPETTPKTVSEILVTIKYGTPQQTVSNATYVSNPNSGLVTDGLVLNLDAGSTDSYPGSGATWTDLSGFGNNGTLVNGVGYSADNGGSLTFDGVNDTINLGSTILNNVTEGSVGLWMKTTMTPASNGGQPWLNTSLLSNDNIYLGIQLLTNYKVRAFYWNTDATPKTVDSTNSVSLNEWYFIAYTWNSIGSNIYINGVLNGTSNTLTWTNVNVGHNNQINYLGSINGSTYLFKGNISNVYFYNRALSPSEINQNYEALKSRYQL